MCEAKIPGEILSCIHDVVNFKANVILSLESIVEDMYLETEADNQRSYTAVQGNLNSATMLADRKDVELQVRAYIFTDHL